MTAIVTREATLTDHDAESHPGNIDLVALMHRRAELLESGASADDLTIATNELQTALDGAQPRVRRLSLPADEEVLRRLADLEPVHPLAEHDRSADLANRLSDDRRCFALEHPWLVGHPMNVVWVALTSGMPDSIQAVLRLDREVIPFDSADTAVFYSIWKVEPGLSGIPGGASLLVQVVDALRLEFPHLIDFVTLSPIPGFRGWRESNVLDRGDNRLDGDSELLARQCAGYLLTMGDDDRPIDPVARFHMRNGARLWRLTPNGDHSARGLERSYGLMANYRYAPEDLSANRGALDLGRPACGSQILNLVGQESTHSIDHR